MSDIVDRLKELYVQHGTNYVQEAAREIEQLRADARRYRWLREHWFYGAQWTQIRSRRDGPELDAGIDEAMQEKGDE